MMGNLVVLPNTTSIPVDEYLHYCTPMPVRFNRPGLYRDGNTCWKEGYLRDLPGRNTEHLTLERKDVNGNYCPANCTWVTRAEQNRNTTRTQRKEVAGDS